MKFHVPSSLSSCIPLFRLHAGHVSANGWSITELLHRYWLVEKVLWNRIMCEMLPWFAIKVCCLMKFIVQELRRTSNR